MTIQEAVTQIDALKPNAYSSDDKVRWLNTLDGRIKTEIIDTREDGGDVIFEGYDTDTDTDTVLLAGAPYDELYIYFLESQIDYMNGETARYANSTAMFESVLSAYRNAYNRLHLPIGQTRKFW